MRHLLVRGPLLGLLAVLFLLQAQSAGAIIEWCWSDPVVEIGGQTMYVYVSGPVDLRDAVTAPTVVVISVPAGVPHVLIATDAGFGLGWEVHFAESNSLRVTDGGIETRVHTLVPADASLPVRIDVTNSSNVVLASVTGTTNTVNTATARL